MAASTVAALGGVKQDPNPVQTGLDGYVQAGELLETSCLGWDHPDRNDVVFLRALVRLTQASPEAAGDGFTPTQIAETARDIAGKDWGGAHDSSTEIGQRLRRIWNQLEGKLWSRKEEGIRQVAEDMGMPFYPVPERISGGGAGITTRYRFRLYPITRDEAGARISEPPGARHGPDVGEAIVRYVCEDIVDAGGIARVLATGYGLHGWRVAFFAFLVVGGLVLGVTAWVWMTLVPLTATPVSHLAILTTFAYIGWSSTWPVLVLGEKRIVRAPWWLQPFGGWEDRLLELRRIGPEGTPQIKAVCYRAPCARCDGTLHLHTGGIEFPGRLVGRCSNSPREHVFSFDHVSRQGRGLR